ncbi:hypothetical protein GYMLUDRAFT_168457 [Collybiopsis luxurians FD-317 M1]|uniref:Uncharacterized protein n=1 Tax=Collybiopsis luxurians FD-317 M1 TaxID=944289 RepID=A0A0D0CCI7_9AGAR|nr:hypothetical protein GYMLUDRAFT_168457 [Collybiopsis luxurians FD-317 M1]
MRTLPHAIDIFRRYLYLILWLTAFIYFFDLSNQITGVDEDRINKPDRPLPSGKVTLAGAKKRWVVSLLAFLAITLYHPILLTETISWIIVVYFLEATSFGDHWFVKSCLAMGAGTWALLRGSWKAIAPLTPLAERYVLAMSLWTGLLTHIQDLRDIKGDAAIGRQTLPIAIGDSQSRWVITLSLMPVSLVGLWIGGILALAPVPIVGAHVFLGYRIIQKRGALYDHKTYMVSWSTLLVQSHSSFEP